MNRKFRLALRDNPGVGIHLGVTDEIQGDADLLNFGFKNTYEKFYLPKARSVPTPTLTGEDARDFKRLVASANMNTARLILDAVSGKESCGDIVISEVRTTGFKLEKVDGDYLMVDA